MTDEAAAGESGSAAGVSRRGFLRALSLGALGLGGAMVVSSVAGCAVEGGAARPGAGGRSGTATSPTPPPPEPDAGLALAAAAEEAALADFCSAVLKAQPSLRSVVQPLRARQREHVDALKAAVVGAVPSTVGPGTPPTGSGTPRVLGKAADVLGELERRLVIAERRRFDDCLAAESGSLGRMLASISASHAQSLVVLRRSS